MRTLKAFITAGAMLAATQTFGTLPTCQISTPQTAEVEQQPETVQLTISGMT